MLKDKYIEVWNKVDLVGQDAEEDFQQRVEWAA